MACQHLAKQPLTALLPGELGNTTVVKALGEHSTSYSRESQKSVWAAFCCIALKIVMSLRGLYLDQQILYLQKSFATSMTESSVILCTWSDFSDSAFLVVCVYHQIVKHQLRPTGRFIWGSRIVQMCVQVFLVCGTWNRLLAWSVELELQSS